MIDFSIKEIILSIYKTVPPINFIDKHLIWLYELVTKFLIRKWRKAAWNNYLKLKKKEITEEEIEINATKIADKICIIGNIIS